MKHQYAGKPMKYNIAIGADHRGFMLKEFIKSYTFQNYEIEWLDVGTFSSERTDYPLYTVAVCHAVLEKKTELGIVLCANGVGVTIAANRFKYIYCGLAWNSQVARQAREDDNSNVLALPAEYITHAESLLIINAWLTASFKKEHYQTRLNQIDSL
jgi:ribose 5-phosphate isomerase B